VVWGKSSILLHPNLFHCKSFPIKRVYCPRVVCPASESALRNMSAAVMVANCAHFAQTLLLRGRGQPHTSDLIYLIRYGNSYPQTPTTPLHHHQSLRLLSFMSSTQGTQLQLPSTWGLAEKERLGNGDKREESIRLRIPLSSR
jgi:hypothetical protein